MPHYYSAKVVPGQKETSCATTDRNSCPPDRVNLMSLVLAQACHSTCMAFSPVLTAFAATQTSDLDLTKTLAASVLHMCSIVANIYVRIISLVNFMQDKSSLLSVLHIVILYFTVNL